MRAALSTKGAENQPVELCCFGRGDLVVADLLHLLCEVDFFGQLLLERIILVKRQVRIPYHTTLDMEPPIAHEHDHSSNAIFSDHR